MKGTRIVRVIYLDCRGISQPDINSYVDDVRDTFGAEPQQNQEIELIFVPVRSETRIDHIILDLDQVRIAKVMEEADFKEIHAKYATV